MTDATSQPADNAAPMSKPRMLIAYAPIILLTVVAFSQIYLAYFSELLTPSKGGGFGLFSTVDKMENRNFRAYLITPQGEIAFAIPHPPPYNEPLRKPIIRASSIPAQRYLLAVADALARKKYEVPIEGVRVEVWKLAFDPFSRVVMREKVRELTILRPADASN